MLYSLGFLVAFLFIFFSFDDLIWDIVFLCKARLSKGKGKKKIPLADLNEATPRLLAVIVPAWQEDNVLYNVIRHLVETAQYPRAMYEIFLGVYPNDAATVAVAKKLETEFDNVHMIVNAKPGPTSKADNVNHVFRSIKAFEEERAWAFAGFILHDSEDVVHPYEFLMENYLIGTYDAVQFPVFPLQRLPRLRNFFVNMTAGAYADEFAENHFHTMVARDLAGAFVPSAGTGFALSRKLVVEMGFDNIFPENSLTEDYRLALTLKKRGVHLHYVLETVERLQDDGRIAREFIATRSRFPGDFKAAVKQKSRWIYGIAMQSFRLREELRRESGLPLAARYSLYKDWKAKYANLLNILGYGVFIYFILSLSTDLAVMYPYASVSWYLSLVMTGMMIERLLMRGMAVKNVYGWRSVAVACLLPPLLPIRLIWGNVIKFAATCKAWKRKLFGNRQRKAGREKWDKTEHAFLERQALRRIHRKLGDVLLREGQVAPKDLRDALAIARREQRPLGAVLRAGRQIGEEELLQALAQVHHTVSLPLHSLPFGVEQGDNRGLFQTYGAYPIFLYEDSAIVALSVESPPEAKDRLAAALKRTVKIVFSTAKEIEAALSRWEEAGENSESGIKARYHQGQINGSQALLAYQYREKTKKPEADLLHTMGFLSPPSRPKEQGLEREAI